LATLAPIRFENFDFKVETSHLFKPQIPTDADSYRSVLSRVHTRRDGFVITVAPISSHVYSVDTKMIAPIIARYAKMPVQACTVEELEAT
jgi:hypothetical protein